MLYDDYITAYKMALLRKADPLVEAINMPISVLEKMVNQCLEGAYFDARPLRLVIGEYTEDQSISNKIVYILQAFNTIGTYKVCNPTYTGFTDNNFWNIYGRYAVNTTTVQGADYVHRLLTVDATEHVTMVHIRVYNYNSKYGLEAFSKEYSASVNRNTLAVVVRTQYDDGAFLAEVASPSCNAAYQDVVLSDMRILQSSIRGGIQ